MIMKRKSELPYTFTLKMVAFKFQKMIKASNQIKWKQYFSTHIYLQTNTYNIYPTPMISMHFFALQILLL